MLIMCELRNANGLFGLKIRPWFLSAYNTLIIYKDTVFFDFDLIKTLRASK
ncbi:hypothetical protein M2134_001975 [Parabacteroides sp. PM6-13]|nr:hypothetical protein [Parabacteroides sp. PM6-13]